MTERASTWQVRDNRDPESKDPWPVALGVANLVVGLAVLAFLALLPFGYVDPLILFLEGAWGKAAVLLFFASHFALVIRYYRQRSIGTT